MSDYKAATQALKFLLSTDQEIGRLKALYVGLDNQTKTIEAIEFMNATGSAAERTQRAKASKSVQSHLKKVSDALCAFETLRNQRNTQTMIIEMFRSVNSAMKRGNI